MQGALVVEVRLQSGLGAGAVVAVVDDVGRAAIVGGATDAIHHVDTHAAVVHQRGHGAVGAVDGDGHVRPVVVDGAEIHIEGAVFGVRRGHVGVIAQSVYRI